ncbi:Npun_F0494 family protein [Leptolyngbya sp. KIOST-1]|uniref:Npun_F0494 family protein n=1 Tax=Leptolyngbya sp. KIOST-1 TaxID=1229172 RepID=UPI00055B7F32|nr:Npun_F0494 family protein [Leptolyngbya sp. KIOST-1]
MAPVMSDPAIALRYPRRSLRRAERAFRCSPFRLDLLGDMRSRSISIRQVCGPAGVKSRYSHRPLAELRAENEMMWLIAVGLLRREVDGQGLTDSFRLTPMGRQVFEQLSLLSPAQYRPSLGDHFYNAWCRWVRWPYGLGL